MDSSTGQFRALSDVEDLFSKFVQFANEESSSDESASGAHAMPVRRDAAAKAVLGDHTDPSVVVPGSDTMDVELLDDIEVTEDLSEESGSLTPSSLTDEQTVDEPSPDFLPLVRRKGPGVHTQRREADDIVPDVASVVPPPPPVPERSEGGHIPAGELDRVLADIGVLHRYGHRDQVEQRVDALLKQYPKDLLLLRRISEFHIEMGDKERGMERLFSLAAALFERRNFEGMRRALEQVFVLDPGNRRAEKLLALLDKRKT